MPWVVDPTTGYQVWEDETGNRQPTAAPSPAGGRPAPPLTRNEGVSQLGQSASGQAVDPRPEDPRAKLGRGVPGQPGYTYEYNAQGQIVAQRTNATASSAAGYYQALGSDQNARPAAPPRVTHDPATGAPLGGSAPRQPAPGSSLGANYSSQHRTAEQRTGEVRAPSGTQPSTPAAGAGTASYVARDFSPQQEAIARLQQTEADFYSQLDRLRGVDPFGNQAALQKATDRAVAQAAGTAAGTRGGAAAQAGAQSRAVGVQAQTAARGAQDIAAQRRADEVQAAQLGIQTVGGIGQIRSQIVGAQAQIADQVLADAELNLRSYLGGRELDQRERDSLRNLSTQLAQIDQQRYATDVGYRQSVDDNVTRLLMADKNLEGIMAQIEAGGDITGKDWFMGLMGMAGGVAGGLATKSDRRSKKAFAPAKTKDLKEFLGSGRGEFYEYRQPTAPGQRPGLNFGGMAQDLQRTKIGRTVVVERKDGLYVDTSRLAMATHGALGHLAKRLERLEKRGKRG